MADEPSSIIRESSSLISREGSFGAFIQNSLVGGILLAGAYQLIRLIQSLGSTILKPFQAFADGLATFITGTFGGPPILLDAAVATAVQSVREGLVSQFGIWAYPLTMVAIMATLYVFSEGFRRIDLSPWNFLRKLRR